MASHEAHQALLQPHEEQQETGFRNEKQIKSMQNLNLNNHLKSFEILKSAVKNIITSNTNLMFLMILSTLPFSIFMVIYEIIIIPEVIDTISNFLIPPSLSYTYNFNGDDELDLDENDPIRKNIRLLLELFPFYLVLLPLLELFSFPIIINVAAKTYAGVIQSSSTLKQEITELFYHKYNLKGTFITSIWVQLLSICTLSGLFWTVLSHHYIIYHLYFGKYYDHVELLSFVFHAVIFFTVLYKYLEWCAMWNMGMVICVLQRETGVYALQMSDHYGKPCKRTGFELMLIFFAYSVVLRLPFIVADRIMFSYVSENYVSFTVDVVSVIVVLMVCLGSLVKWVAIVLYFYECKAQVLSKKVDEEVGNVVKKADLCNM